MRRLRATTGLATRKHASPVSVTGRSTITLLTGDRMSLKVEDKFGEGKARPPKPKPRDCPQCGVNSTRVLWVNASANRGWSGWTHYECSECQRRRAKAYYEATKHDCPHNAPGWSKEERRIAAASLRAGESFREIARTLGKSRNSVAGFAYRLKRTEASQ